MNFLEKQKALCRKARIAAGPRYSKEISVDLGISNIFDGLCQEQKFKDQSLQLLGELSRSFSDFLVERNDAEDSSLNHSHSSFQAILRKFLEDPSQTTQVRLAKVIVDLKQFEDSLQKFLSGLYSSKEESNNDGLKSKSRKLIDCLRSTRNQFTSDESYLFKASRLWLYGTAGSGKTHLFCDVAEKRLAESKPTILLMGQKLTQSTLWQSLCKVCEIETDGSPKKSFLKFIDLHADNFDSKLLLMVDAINENRGIGIWSRSLKSFVAELKKRKHVSIALSCRSSFQSAIADDSYIESEFRKVEHRGFANELPEAIEAFFSHYNIKHHEIPLVREFENPLFLKIYCLTHKGQDTPYRGHAGLKDILEKYFHYIDANVLAVRLGYPKAQKPAWQIGKLIAEWMAKNRAETISRSDADSFSKSIGKKMGIKTEILPEMVEEGLLIEDMDESDNTPIISFSYQRFSDILIGRYLLSEKAGFDRKSPQKSFCKGGSLEHLVESPWRYSGQMEAISSILPEWTNGQYEILDVVPHNDRSKFYDYWLDSLVWRSSESFPKRKKLRSILNEISSKNPDAHHRILDTLLSIATTPEHPLNADFLNQILKRMTMLRRDVFWSIYLHYSYEENSVIDRLIEWSWLNFRKVRATEESARLASIVLAWFCTSQNRFLRDRATKSIVCLISRRLSVLNYLLKLFSKVNDPYVLERVLVSAYGAVIRSNDPEGIKKVAQTSYNLFFKNGSPPTNIVTRFYARGLIKFAQYHGVMRHVSNKIISPPFSSTKFPNRLPKLITLEKKYRLETSGRFDSSQNAIVSSTSSFGDFGRYVLGTDGKVSDWFYPLRDPKRDYRAWETALPPTKRKSIETYKMALELSKFNDRYLQTLTKAKIERRSLLKILSVLRNELGLAGEKNKKIRENVEAVLCDRLNRVRKLPAELLQRYVLMRVFSLGWNLKDFGDFDRNVNYHHSRSANKNERFGKKYQWIAYFELLAILSDHCEFEKRDKKKFLEIDDLSSAEQIDPTIVLRKPSDRPIPDEGFNFYTYSDWNPGVDHITWLHDKSDYPNMLELVDLKDNNQKGWLLLEGMYNFEQPSPPDQEKYSTERRSIWFIINSYLFKLDDLAKVKAFLNDANFIGRWMPHSTGMIHPHFGEIGWSERYFRNRDSTWDTSRDVPFKFAETTESYLYESGTFDYSMEDSFTIYLPKQPLRDLAGLKNHWIDGNYVNSANEIVARDLFEAKSPGGLIFERSTLFNILKENNLGVFWSILSERDIHSPINDRQWRGRLEFSTGLLSTGDSLVEVEPKFIFRDPPS